MIYIYYTTAMTEQKKGSGRLRSVCTEENVSAVKELALSQEEQSQTHRSMCQKSREIGIYKSSVFCITHDDLGMKCLEKRRAQELTQANRAVWMQRVKKAAGNVPGA